MNVLQLVVYHILIAVLCSDKLVFGSSRRERERERERERDVLQGRTWGAPCRKGCWW